MLNIKRIILIVFFAIGCLALSIISFAQDKLELTIYNQDYALVKVQKTFPLKAGINYFSMEDIAALIDPVSVSFSPKDKTFALLEQSFEYDLSSWERLLEKSIDLPLKITTKDNKFFEGKLITFDNANITLSCPEGLRTIPRADNITNILFDKSLKDLYFRPALLWKINSAKEGPQDVEITYITKGINWSFDYVLMLDSTDTKMNFQGWMTIDNRSGAVYQDATVQLVLGEVKRIQVEAGLEGLLSITTKDPQAEQQANASQGGEDKSLKQYYYYKLPYPLTIFDAQAKQVLWVSTYDIGVTKDLIFDPSHGEKEYLYYSEEEAVKDSIKTVLEFNNNLGVVLPKGKVRVYKKNKEELVELLGEDTLNHINKDQKVRIHVGQAPDLFGERTRINVDKQYRSLQETFEITLTNRRQEEVEVKVVEKLWRYTNWQVSENSDPWQKQDNNIIEFKVKIPKNSEKKIKYTVKYTW